MGKSLDFVLWSPALARPPYREDRTANDEVAWAQTPWKDSCVELFWSCFWSAALCNIDSCYGNVMCNRQLCVLRMRNPVGGVSKKARRQA